jgi:hypothetical protein
MVRRMKTPNDGVTLTSVEHPHSLLDPVEALFDKHGLDINEHQALIREIEAWAYDQGVGANAAQ